MELSTGYEFLWRKRGGQLWLTLDWGHGGHATRFKIAVTDKDYDGAILDMLELLRQRQLKDRPFALARAPGSKRRLWRGGIRLQYAAAVRLTALDKQADEAMQCTEHTAEGIIPTADFAPARGWRLRPVIELRNREAQTLFALLTLGNEPIDPPLFRP